ncbi:MAG TPA: 30S ribosomal protein S4 [Nitrospirae bacterium]|nr:30S ribosomal protein S4 [bacterium BMS3Bbin09]HDH34736.1 30S ribosomal protein S4 [Nitrospirota bacterium]HDN95149.1 30S ribosomal protein S4 [Nitrospirota bacterium]HDO66658.1 30S ribosomal protein S4 [Nitrospirota bacterium]HDZ84146.1 30S ribosomal protein S4 [Nitrospirota bacterium]
MARYREALCRLCRREGEKLFLKGDRCYTEKCGVERRKYGPGQHGQRRKKLSDYALQLREKQKAKETYGVLEGQFKRYYFAADKKKGVTGSNLLQLLESRLDNVFYRLGFASNRRQARQMVLHGHVTLNGRRVNIPSCLVSADDEISIKEASRKNVQIEENISKIEHRGLPAWLEVDAENFKGKVLHPPTREEIELPVQEQLIIELYSK